MPAENLCSKPIELTIFRYIDIVELPPHNDVDGYVSQLWPKYRDPEHVQSAGMGRVCLSPLQSEVGSEGPALGDVSCDDATPVRPRA